ncbi:MAG: hypothetical protein AMJ81_01080 [Phycisphaerae bacterium SM23_33]|nr:MAG: hypothetical protein AMJ81_01080 [Phycisphaerae bacterium SM23_33]
MRTNGGIRRGGAWGCFLAAMLACGSAALAGSDYSDKDLSLRFPSAFIRFSEVSASGGETVANRFSSALNPASAGWMELPCKYGLVLAPYYSHTCFDAGTRLHLFGESLTWETEKWGTFQPTLSQIRTNRATTRQGLEFDYSVDIFQLQWGKRLGDWGLGARFNYAQAETVYKMGPMRVSKSNAESYRVRLGGLYAPAEKWLAGIALEYGVAHSRTTRYMGPFTFKDRATSHQFVARPGVSYEYAKYCTVFADYHYGAFFHGHKQFHYHRFSAGVEHRLLDFLFLRAGPFVDARGNTGLTCGATVHFSRWGCVELGYQYDPLPELRPEFGRSHMFQAVLSVRF